MRIIPICVAALGLLVSPAGVCAGLVGLLLLGGVA